MVVWEGYAAVRFLPVLKQFIAAHVEETLVLHKAAVSARDDFYSQLMADCSQLYSIPMQAPIRVIAFDEEL